MDEMVKKASNGFIWRLLEQFGAQGVTFIVSIILARLLDPEVYGNIALVTIFITIFQVFVDSGLGNSLIQKKDADEIDFSTVFWCNIVFCLLLYCVLFFISPLIAAWYGQNELTSVLRVLGLTILISGVKNIQQAYVSKNMQFKKFFYATLGGTIGAAIIGISFAYLGLGIWALVAQNVFNTLVDTIVLWCVVKWKPRFVFSFSRLKSLFSFGWKILASKLIDTIYENVRSLIIGKMYSSEDLAFYNRAKQFPMLLVANINSSIDSILFPTISSVQNDLEKVKSITRRSIKTSTFIVFPMMAGLIACAEPMIHLLLTEKWASSIPYLRILSCAMAFYPILTANLNAIKSIGKADIYLRLEITRKIVNGGFLLIAMWLGVRAIAYSLLANSIVNMIINSFPNRKFLHYGFIDQIRDVFPVFLASVIMCLAVSSINLINISYLLKIVIEIPVGVGLYIVLAKVFRIDSLPYLLEIAKIYLRREKR